MFYWDDSDEVDIKRIVMFSTSNSFKCLENHRDWYADGTFDISPTLPVNKWDIYLSKSVWMASKVIVDKWPKLRQGLYFGVV